MIAAVTVAILVMLVSAEAVAGIVNRHPTLKMLALSFLLLIGLALLLEGFDQHIPKGYIYFAIYAEISSVAVMCHIIPRLGAVGLGRDRRR
jgi:predicted tellurium resistance membrane protein TerC